MIELPKRGSYRIIHHQTHEIAYGIWKHMSEEVLNGVKVRY
jgi:hypothetical protein